MINRRLFLASVTAAVGLLSRVSRLFAQSSGSAVPNITALPEVSLGVPPWTAFLQATGGKRWSLNTSYIDAGGVALRRLTDRSTLSNGDSCGLEYSEGPAKISQQFDGNRYWVAFQDNGNGYYLGKYQLGVGFVSVVQPSWSTLVEGNLGVCFSMLPGEEEIVYVANKGGDDIRRYDCNAQAYASNSVFTGATASFHCGVKAPGWLQTSWDGSRLVWQAPVVGPTSVFRLMTQTGSLSAYTGSPTSTIMLKVGSCSGATATSLTDASRNWSLGPDGNGQWVNATITMMSGAAAGQSAMVSKSTINTLTFSPAFKAVPAAGDTYSIMNVNEIHMFRGTQDVVVLEDNSSLGSFPYFWFPSQNVCTQAVAYSYKVYGGHADAGASCQYTLNPQGAITGLKQIQTFTAGSPPSADGGPWTGSQESFFGTTPQTDIDNASADGHFNMTWNQSNATAGNEWALRDSNGDYSPASAQGWSLQSGNIYQTKVNFSPQYSNAARGVVGVVLWNGISGKGCQYTGNLATAVSMAAMVAGTYFWSGSALFVWMPDGSNPGGKVIISSAALQSYQIAFFKGDGTQIRRASWTYSVTSDVQNNYYNEPFPNASPDGRVVVFNSDLGTYDGYFDLVAAELPTGSLGTTPKPPVLEAVS